MSGIRRTVVQAVVLGLAAVLHAMALHAPIANAQEMGETVDVGERSTSSMIRTSAASRR